MIFSGNSKISGVGSYIPGKNISTEEELEGLRTESRFGIPKNWMSEELGIVSKRYCDESLEPSDISVEAAAKAIFDAGIEAKDLSAIIYCGITGDFIEPGTAHIIANKLGADNAICKDVHNACHGFCDGLLFGDLMVRGGAEHVLVVTAELTRVRREVYPVLEREGNLERFMYKLGMLSVGDAAGAMVLSKKDNTNEGILSINTASHGRSASLCSYDLKMGEATGGICMDKIGKVTFRHCTKLLPETLARLEWSREDVNHFVMHQVGQKPFEMAKKSCRFKLDQMPKTFDCLGNMTTATLPINYEIVKKSGNFSLGDKMFMLGTGPGVVLLGFGVTM